jgi:hypothetical protein
MRASHIIVTILGFAVSFAMIGSMRTFIEVVGADASESPYTGLWVFTPYNADRIEAKIFLQGGDGVSLTSITATIDGKDVTMPEPEKNERRPSRRFDMGKLELGLSIPVPADLPAGDHVLAFDLETSCTGSSFSKACGHVQLEAPIAPGNALLRIWAVLRALLAAAAVWLVVRKGKRRVVAWANDAGKSAPVLGVAFIPLLVLWGYCSYWVFARSLSAGLGTSSDILFAFAIIGWLVLLPFALIWKRHEIVAQSYKGICRFVPEPLTPGEDEVGYRAAAVKEVPHRVRTLDEIVTMMGSHARMRRSRNRIVPGWFRSAPVTFLAEKPDDVTSGELQIEGPFGYILVHALRVAASFGPFDLTIDGKTARVERDDSVDRIAAELR